MASEDASALLGGGRAGAQLVPWHVRALRGRATTRAAAEPPPAPPADYQPSPEGYKPPSAFEAGDNIFNLDAILKPKEYAPPRRPLPTPPAELLQLHELSKQPRRRGAARGIDAIGCAALLAARARVLRVCVPALTASSACVSSECQQCVSVVRTPAAVSCERDGAVCVYRATASRACASYR